MLTYVAGRPAWFKLSMTLGEGARMLQGTVIQPLGTQPHRRGPLVGVGHDAKGVDAVIESVGECGARKCRVGQTVAFRRRWGTK